MPCTVLLPVRASTSPQTGGEALSPRSLSPASLRFLQTLRTLTASPSCNTRLSPFAPCNLPPFLPSPIHAPHLRHLHRKRGAPLQRRVGRKVAQHEGVCSTRAGRDQSSGLLSAVRAVTAAATVCARPTTSCQPAAGLQHASTQVAKNDTVSPALPDNAITLPRRTKVGHARRAGGGVQPAGAQQRHRTHGAQDGGLARHVGPRQQRHALQRVGDRSWIVARAAGRRQGGRLLGNWCGHLEAGRRHATVFRRERDWRANFSQLGCKHGMNSHTMPGKHATPARHAPRTSRLSELCTVDGSQPSSQ